MCGQFAIIDEWDGWVWRSLFCVATYRKATQKEIEEYENKMEQTYKMKKTIKIIGRPIPKGSTRAFTHKKTGKIITMQQNANNLYAWQDKITYEAAKNFEEPTREAVNLKIIFCFCKPKTAKRKYPTVRPDLDKLIRAVLDGLTGIVYFDDSQVVQIESQKIYDESDFCVVEVEI
jgi:Holliday junction resolvase RusA-like endonuclease